MRRPGSPAGLLFRLIIPATALFVITILAVIACVFGDPRAPAAKWLDQYANLLLTIEFGMIIALALAAMTVDRIRTLRTSSTGEQPVTSGSEPATAASDSSDVASPEGPVSTESTDRESSA